MSRIIRTTQSQGPNLALHREASERGSAEIAADVLQAAYEQARQIRATAEVQAQLVAEESLQLIQLEKEALASEAGERMEAQFEEAGEQIRSLVREVERQREELLARLSREVIELALAIAGRVVRRNVRESGDLTVRLAEESLRLVHGSSKTAVRLHPSCLDANRSQFENLIAEFDSLGKVCLVTDPGITPGGCIVETEYGTIDQTIETQLERIAQELQYE